MQVFSSAEKEVGRSGGGRKGRDGEAVAKGGGEGWRPWPPTGGVGFPGLTGGALVEVCPRCNPIS